MDAKVIRDRWHSNAEDVLKHLWKSTEGEVAELRGTWEPRHGQWPTEGDEFYHQQFALDEQQWKSKGSGKSADGDWSNRAISFRPSDVGALGHRYAYRRAMVITFPVLMEKLGDKYTARELWAFYKSLCLLAVRRKHSWGSQLVQAASWYRYRTYGYYGHGR